MNIKQTIALGAVLISTGALWAQQALPQLGKDKIEDVVAAMTLQEKVDMVLGLGDATWKNPETGTPTVLVPGAAGCTYSIPRLGITPAALCDGPAGLRIIAKPKNANGTRYCTAFPTATAMASTWNTDLEQQVGKSMGNEVLEYGADVLLAPAMNIQRNPLNGRNFEYFSEDPVVTGKIAAAFVKGIQSEGVGTSIKHFVANNSESNRGSVNEVISQRALREIYLRGFEIAVKESDPWTIMTSYNKLNGFYTSENRELLSTIVRDEWRYKGIIMTDWGGGQDCIAQMQAGNELLMAGNWQRVPLVEAVNNNTLDEKILDRNVARILTFILKTPHYRKYAYSNKPDLAAHALVAKQAAEEAMVLLKNDDQALPFNKVKSIALFGKTSYHFIAGGTGSGEVNYKHSVSLREGLENGKYRLEPRMEKYYTNIIDSVLNSKTDNQSDFGGDRKFAIDRMGEIALSEAQIKASAKASDIAVITIGRLTGEGADEHENTFFVLSDAERTLINNVTAAYHAEHKKVVVVLNIGGAIETQSWKNTPDAILVAWQTGQEGGNALTDVLAGKANPSGKLAQTFPATYSDVPSALTFPGVSSSGEGAAQKNPDSLSYDPVNAFYKDGIYVGYRYYDAFKVKPSYEFGYGLSYTTFKFSNLKLSSTTFNNEIQVSVTVENTGKVAGKEVAQVYLSAPQDQMEKPVQELRAFAKTKLLKAGEKQTLTFTLHPRDLASFWTSTSSWIADAGNYEVKVGASSRDIKLTATFNLPQSLVVEKDHYVLQPNRLLEELSLKNKK